MHLDVQTKFSIETGRVKCVDLHPKEPWVLATLHTGEVHIYDYEKQVGDHLRLIFSNNLSSEGIDQEGRCLQQPCSCRQVHRATTMVDHWFGTFFCCLDSFMIDGMFQDDFCVRVFDLQTLECVKQFEAHTDFIRSIVVHPTQPIVLTSGGTFDSCTHRSVDHP